MSIFKGAAVAIITPMTETQEVNYEKLGEIIEEQIAGGTDAIVICGASRYHQIYRRKSKPQNPGYRRYRFQQHRDSHLSVPGSREIRRGRTSSRFSVLQ